MLMIFELNNKDIHTTVINPESRKFTVGWLEKAVTAIASHQDIHVSEISIRFAESPQNA